MTPSYIVARAKPSRNELGRPMPVRFSKTAWWRFARDRRRRYLAEISGPPTNEQAAKIDGLIRQEWFSLKAEAEGTTRGDREPREHRRLFDRFLSDFKRSVSVKPPARPASLAEHLSKIAAEPRCGSCTAFSSLGDLAGQRARLLFVHTSGSNRCIRQRDPNRSYLSTRTSS